MMGLTAELYMLESKRKRLSPEVSHAASELPVEVAMRRSLLEIRSEAERQAKLVAHLTEWYPQLQKREHVRGKAAGNGHGKL